MKCEATASAAAKEKRIRTNKGWQKIVPSFGGNAIDSHRLLKVKSQTDKNNEFEYNKNKTVTKGGEVRVSEVKCSVCLDYRASRSSFCVPPPSAQFCANLAENMNATAQLHI
jgi:hypothetical protein